jgi:hypothetical protein
MYIHARSADPQSRRYVPTNVCERTSFDARSSRAEEVTFSRAEKGTDERALCLFEDGIPHGVSVRIRCKRDFRERKPEAQGHSTLARQKGAYL